MNTCDTFWGSHGCGLPEGHDPDEEHPIHACLVEEYDDEAWELRGWAICCQAQYVDRDTIRIRRPKVDGWQGWTERQTSLFGLDDRLDVR